MRIMARWSRLHASALAVLVLSLLMQAVAVAQQTTTITVDTPKGVLAAMQNAGCGDAWLAQVLAENAIAPSSLRGIPKGKVLTLSVQCTNGAQPSARVARLSVQLIRADARGWQQAITLTQLKRVRASGQRSTAQAVSPDGATSSADEVQLRQRIAALEAEVRDKKLRIEVLKKQTIIKPQGDGTGGANSQQAAALQQQLNEARASEAQLKTQLAAQAETLRQKSAEVTQSTQRIAALERANADLQRTAAVAKQQPGAQNGAQASSAATDAELKQLRQDNAELRDGMESYRQQEKWLFVFALVGFFAIIYSIRSAWRARRSRRYSSTGYGRNPAPEAALPVTQHPNARVVYKGVEKEIVPRIVDNTPYYDCPDCVDTKVALGMNLLAIVHHYKTDHADVEALVPEKQTINFSGPVLVRTCRRCGVGITGLTPEAQASHDLVCTAVDPNNTGDETVLDLDPPQLQEAAR